MPKTKLVNKSTSKKTTFEKDAFNYNKKFHGFLAKQAAKYLAKCKELEDNTQQVSKQSKMNKSDDVASSRKHRQTHVHQKDFNSSSQSEGTAAAVSETSNNIKPSEVLIKTERDLYETEIKPCIKTEYTTGIEPYIKKEYTTETEPYIKKEYRDDIHTNVKQEVMNDSVDKPRNIKCEIVISDSENDPVTHIKQEVVLIDSDDEFQVKQERTDKHENKVNVKKEADGLTNLIKHETDVQDESYDMDYEILSISSDSENEFCTYVKQEIVLSDSEDESVIAESLLNEDNVQTNTRKAMINENASQTAAESQTEAVTSKDHPNLQNEPIRRGRNKICTTKTKNQTETVTNKHKPNQNEPTRTDNNKIDANQTQTRVKADQKLNKTTQLNVWDPNVRKELDTRTLFVGNLPDTVKKIDLQNFFKRYGEIEKIGINKKPNNIPLAKYPVIVDGYIRFEKRDDALKALEVNGMEYRKRHLKVVIKKNAFRYLPDKTIVVTGLPCNTETDDLWNIFESCGIIASITLSRNKHTGEVQGLGYIEFELAGSVELALRMKDVKLGEHKLYIRKYFIRKILNDPARRT